MSRLLSRACGNSLEQAALRLNSIVAVSQITSSVVPAAASSKLRQLQQPAANRLLRTVESRKYNLLSCVIKDEHPAVYTYIGLQIHETDKGKFSAILSFWHGD